jgi:hypothetical protein
MYIRKTPLIIKHISEEELDELISFLKETKYLGENPFKSWNS